jgi:hypothetical protein
LQISELESQCQKHAHTLKQAQEERKFFSSQIREIKSKYKTKRKEWSEERGRLMRCLEAQTSSNASHLQEISRQLGPNGSLRQSLDLTFSQAGSDWGGTPLSAASMRRHSFAHPGAFHSRIPCGSMTHSMCSSPRVDSLGFPVNVSIEVRSFLNHSARTMSMQDPCCACE